MNDNNIHDMNSVDEGITFKELVNIITRYYWLILLIVFITLVFAGVYLLMTEPVYQASSQIVIEAQRSSIFMDESFGFPVTGSPVIFNTAVERIQGRSLTDSVIVKTSFFAVIEKKASDYITYFASPPPDSIKKFKIVISKKSNNDFDYQVFSVNGDQLAKGYFGKKLITEDFSIVIDNLLSVHEFELELVPLKTARGRVLSNLEVSNIRNTNIIEISFKHVTPEGAKNVTNAYVEEYVNQNLMEKREEATVSRTFLENQFEKVSAQLKNAEDNYKDFKVSAGFVALDEQINQYINQLRFLEEKRIDYEIRINEASTSKERSEVVLSGDPDLQKYTKFASSPFFRENIILQELYSKIAELQVEYARLSAEYKPTHPLVVKNKAELEAARTQLEEAISTVINNATEGVDPLLRPIVEKLLLSHINIYTYNQVLNQIKSEIAKLDTIMQSLPEAEVEQAQLQRRIGVNEQIYNLLLTRLEETRIMEASTISDIKIIDWAELPQEPIAPSKRKIFLLALMGGLFVSALVIFGLEHFKTSFSTIESLERELSLPVIAIIPALIKRRKREQEIFVNFEKKEDHHKVQAFELFNTLRINLIFAEDFQKSKTLIVTSALPKEGKTFVAANLAVTMAHAGMRVMIIDCDFRNPTQHIVFNVSNSFGLTDFINNGSPDKIIKTEYQNLFLLPSGSLNNTIITELINNSDLIYSIDKLRDSYDLIIIDTPPVNLFTDAVVLSSHFKNVLFVMKYNTMKDAAIYSRKILSNIDANILGIVVNDLRKSGLSKTQYGYGYGYGYGYVKDIKKQNKFRLSKFLQPR